jgi:pimeloyl-ACP methyl ester carboxylesterase
MLHVVLAVIVAASPAANLYATPGRRISVAGRRLNLVCRGSGRPVVVFEGGLGDWSPSWIPVQQRLAATTTVCTYDRAGYGFSDPAPSARTSDAIARDLRDLLRAAHLPAPYVLVGHSFGGLNVQAFTERYRRDVAGLVLVDGTPADVQIPASITALENAWATGMQKCATAARRGAFSRNTPAFTACFNDLFGITDLPNNGVTPALIAAVKEQARKPAPYEAALSENQNFEESQREVRAQAGSFGCLPMVVLIATRHGENDLPPAARAQMLRFEPLWRAAQDRVAARSTCAKRVLVQSDHYIQFYRPDVVIKAVNAVVSTVRTTGKM